MCEEINNARIAYLRRINPTARIEVHTAGSVYEDFRLLVNAPRLFSDQSTFSLAAGLSSLSGVVHMPPLFGQLPFNSSNWVWSESPVFLPHMAVELGLSCSTDVTGTGEVGAGTCTDKTVLKTTTARDSELIVQFLDSN